MIQIRDTVLARPLAHVAIEPRLSLTRACSGVDDYRLVEVFIELERCLAGLHQLGRLGEVILLARWLLACVARRSLAPKQAWMEKNAPLRAYSSASTARSWFSRSCKGRGTISLPFRVRFPQIPARLLSRFGSVLFLVPFFLRETFVRNERTREALTAAYSEGSVLLTPMRTHELGWLGNWQEKTCLGRICAVCSDLARHWVRHAQAEAGETSGRGGQMV